MLLVDDDEADVRERREDGRPRADDHVDVAAADALPLVVALAVGQAAVLDGHAIDKPQSEGGRHAQRQGDFGHEHQGTPARSQRVLGEPRVQLRFAASGHAVHEGHVERAFVEPAPQLLERHVLFRRQRHVRRLRGRLSRPSPGAGERVALHGLPPDAHEFAEAQPAKAGHVEAARTQRGRRKPGGRRR